MHKKPKHLKNLYSHVELSKQVLEEIYNPNMDLSSKKWGIVPDFAIENSQTKKILFGEIKRQDGWIEGKKPNDGRGNVHERFSRYFTPGLLKECRKISGINNKEILPFWIIFSGDITRDPKRVREITFLFDEYTDNFFMWRPNRSGQDLLCHFNEKLKKYLD